MTGALVDIIWRISDDMIFALWFSMKLKPREIKKKQKWWLVQCLALLLLAIFFWLTSVKANVFTSFAWRITGIFVYLFISKEEDWQKICYAACIFALAYYGFTIIFVTPVLSEVRRGELLLVPRSLILNKIVVQVFMWFVSFLLVGIVRNGIDYKQMNSRWTFRGIMCASLAILEIYMKYTLNAFSHKEIKIYEMTIFAFIIMALIMAVMVFVEQYFVKEDRESRRQQMDLLQSYQYETMKERMAADQDIRCMYHDLKNHLLSIGLIAGKDEKIQSYLTSMKMSLESFETLVRTGNVMLDGIISEKMKIAHINNIRMSVYLDFSNVNFIRDIDICTIFGNILDNALEAVMKVEDADKRYIQIKNGVFANHMVIRISNYCKEKIPLEHGFPATTKEDSRLHGLGLLSVKKTVAEYKGVVAIEQEDSQFILKIMMPLTSNP